MPDPAAFLAELGRVVRPGGRLWLITLVAGAGLRGDLVITAGRLGGILPGAPPRRPALLALLRDAGFSRVTPLGGDAITGLAAVRS
jgi:SAM-dependent methyltransferase